LENKYIMNCIKTQVDFVSEGLYSRKDPYRGKTFHEKRSKLNLDRLLDESIHRCSFEVCKVLLEMGADPNSEGNGLTGKKGLKIHDAAGFSTPEIIELLLDYGANVNEKGSRGRTPLHYAAIDSIGNENIDLLLKRGADINKKDSKGWTPIFNAIQSGGGDQVINLVDKGAKLNVANSDGDTPLHMLARQHIDFDILELFLKKGANPSVFNKGMDTNGDYHGVGLTPLHLFSQHWGAVEFEKVLDLLLSHGAEIDASMGKTPLKICAEKVMWGYSSAEDFVKALLLRGADWKKGFNSIEEIKKIFRGDLSWWVNMPDDAKRVQKVSNIFGK